MITRFLKTAGRVFADALFPRFCFGCGSEGEWLCVTCLAGLPRKTLSLCPWCGIVLKDEIATGGVCMLCASDVGVSRLLVVYEYNTLIERTIHAMKYRGAHDIAVMMGEIVACKLKPEITLYGNEVIVPIPLHSRRVRERGFNQADIMGRAIADAWALPYIGGSLMRGKNTDHQALLGAQDREYNMKDAFLIRKTPLISGKTVILVDDVCTTGATLQEAAKVLMEAGALSVTALAFARGHFDYGVRLTGGQ